MSRQVADPDLRTYMAGPANMGQIADQPITEIDRSPHSVPCKRLPFLNARRGTQMSPLQELIRFTVEPESCAQHLESRRGLAEIARHRNFVAGTGRIPCQNRTRSLANNTAC